MEGSSSVPKRLPESITPLTRLYSTQQVRKNMQVYNRHCLRLDCLLWVSTLFVLSVTLTSNRIPLPSLQRITNNRFFHLWFLGGTGGNRTRVLLSYPTGHQTNS